MSIAGDLIRGHTDAIILARLLHGDSYGYEINKIISSLSSGRFELKEATLYTAFRRLEEQGYIISYWGARGGGPGGGTMPSPPPAAWPAKRCAGSGRKQKKLWIS